MDARPIGIFDSGMGGVSLLRDARMLLPTENFIYYGDNLNAPYGDRTEEEILPLIFCCNWALKRLLSPATRQRVLP